VDRRRRVPWRVVDGAGFADVIVANAGLVAAGITGWDQADADNWSAAVWVMERQ